MDMVRIRYNAPTSSGNRRGWGRLVTAVDKSKTNGYAFDGDFLPDGKEVDVPLGSVVIEKTPTGSVKNGSWGWSRGRVTPDGIEWRAGQRDRDRGAPQWGSHQDAAVTDGANFLTFRDRVAEQLAEAAAAAGTIDPDALRAERAKLAERIAEIDRLLTQA